MFDLFNSSPFNNSLFTSPTDRKLMLNHRKLVLNHRKLMSNKKKLMSNYKKMLLNRNVVPETYSKSTAIEMKSKNGRVDGVMKISTSRNGKMKKYVIPFGNSDH